MINKIRTSLELARVGDRKLIKISDKRLNELMQDIKFWFKEFRGNKELIRDNVIDTIRRYKTERKLISCSSFIERLIERINFYFDNPEYVRRSKD